MAIQIKKAGDKFLAEWLDAEGKVCWKNDSPMDRRSLTAELTKAGCHPIDVYDEFEQIDPTSTLKKELPEDVAELFREQARKLEERDK